MLSPAKDLATRPEESQFLDGKLPETYGKLKKQLL